MSLQCRRFYKAHALFQHPCFTHLIPCVPPIAKVYKPHTLCMFLSTSKFHTSHTLCPSYNKSLQTSYTVCVCSFQHPGFTHLIHCVPPITKVYEPHTLCVCSFQRPGFTLCSSYNKNLQTSYIVSVHFNTQVLHITYTASILLQKFTNLIHCVCFF